MNIVRGLVLVVGVVVGITTVTPDALGQWKRDTGVGQVEGTPTGSPGSTVTVKAGLSVWNGSTYYSSCHIGMVKLYYWSGSRWSYAGRANASGCYGTPNSYGLATFRFRIPISVRRNSYVPLLFVYEETSSYKRSVGRGTIAVR